MAVTSQVPVPGAGDEFLHGSSRTASHVVQPRDPGVRHNIDDVPEVVVPVVDRRPQARQLQGESQVVGESPLGVQFAVAVCVQRLVDARLRDVFQRRAAVLVQVVYRRGAECRLKRSAQRQRLRQLHADGYLGVEAADRAVEFVVGGDLGVDPVTELQMGFGEETVHGLGVAVLVVARGEGEGPGLLQTAPVPRNRTGVDRQIARLVRHRRYVEPAELVSHGVLEHFFLHRTPHERVHHNEVGRVVQIDVFIDPADQLAAVLQSGDVLGVRLIAVRGPWLRRVLVRVAERVVVHAVALPGHGAVQRAKGHPGRT